MTDDKKLKIEFAPGAFDGFDGTQEELDALMVEITRMIESGEFRENSKALDLNELYEEDPELAIKLAESLSEEPPNRNLQ